jgi:hypothetical protein
MARMSKRIKVQAFGTGVLVSISVEENMTVSAHLDADDARDLLDNLYAALTPDGADSFPSDMQNFPRA